jgi:hypothetical protein
VTVAGKLVATGALFLGLGATAALVATFPGISLLHQSRAWMGALVTTSLGALLLIVGTLGAVWFG